MSLFLIQHISFPFSLKFSFSSVIVIQHVVIIIFDALIVLNLASGSPLSQFLEPLTQSHSSLSVPILSETAVCLTLFFSCLRHGLSHFPQRALVLFTRE